MNTIEMLKELVENGGMFETDILKGYHVTISSGEVRAISQSTGTGFTVELNKFYLSAHWKPYVKPVDWSKVPIDTKVLCRVNGCVYKRHYAGLHCGHPSVWDSGLTSHSTFDKRIAYEWDSVELADATE